jgi:hypothetical protein
MSYEDTDLILDKLNDVLFRLDANPNLDLDMIIAEENLYDFVDCPMPLFINDNIESNDSMLIKNFRNLKEVERKIVLKYIDCCIQFMKKSKNLTKPDFYDRFVQIFDFLKTND